MGMRAAINSMCKQCIYDPHYEGGGTWRNQVKNCTSERCALFKYRPHPAKPRNPVVPGDTSDLAVPGYK